MDYSDRMAQVRHNMAGSNALVQEARVVACMGSRMALSLLISAIQPGRQLVAATTTEAEALQKLERLDADVLICTDQLERGSGASLVMAAKRAATSAPVRTLMIVGEPRRTASLRLAMQAGCDGLCLEANIGMGTVLQALSTVGNGGIYIARGLSEHYLGALPGGDGPGLTPLTERELEVLQLVTAGFSNGAIGARLYIGAETVKSHLRRILDKLQARDRTHAAIQAIRIGLVDWPEAG
jgi:DNA-binding NarL/FixJ family response regulator